MYWGLRPKCVKHTNQYINEEHTVMYSVVRGSIENKLNNRMQFWHHITVNPKLIKHVEGIMECIQLRREEKRQREIEPISYVKDVFNA